MTRRSSSRISALGPIVQTPAEQCGDLLLKDRDGNWTYQFAVTVDDMNDAVDLIVRGSICSHQPDGRSNWPGCSDAHRRLSSITIRSSSNPTARNSVKRAAIRASASCAPPASPRRRDRTRSQSRRLDRRGRLVDAAHPAGSSAPPAEDDINGARKELRENPCAFGYVTVALFVLN